MLKIKSKIDVITNSSSECFILRTDKTAEEVGKELSEFTSGFCDPSIITEGDEYLEYLVDFGYLVDPDDIESVERYYLDYLQEATYFEDVSLGEEYKRQWDEYVISKFEYLKSYDPDSYKFIEYCPQTTYCVYDLPSGFVMEFVKSHNIPEIPKEKLISSVIGKVGLFSEGDNTIPFEDFDEIVRRYNGTRYHLG